MDDDSRIILAKYDAYKGGDRDECTLLSSRVSALLTSQTLFGVVAAAVYQVEGHKLVGPIRLVAAMAFVMNWIASVSIVIGCQVMRAWHLHGSELIAQDTRSVLAGYRLERKNPDWLHFFSMDRSEEHTSELQSLRHLVCRL